MFVSDNHNKFFKSKNVKFVLAGDEPELETFIKYYFDHKSGEKILTNLIDFTCEGFIIDNKKLFVGQCSAEHGWSISKCNFDEHWALGSGSYYAIGAMDAGVTARAAVKIAKLRDTLTGGRIRSIKI